ncbi:unnamed protein product [Linum trigynum]|uniref:Uncharacterized protein n=1 Tax=Linum trigynum TaxID=586398 RepID=A0AAV2FCA9_9ROSI
MSRFEGFSIEELTKALKMKLEATRTGWSLISPPIAAIIEPLVAETDFEDWFEQPTFPIEPSAVTTDSRSSLRKAKEQEAELCLEAKTSDEQQQPSPTSQPAPIDEF